jgi:hypothetical protein
MNERSLWVKQVAELLAQRFQPGEQFTVQDVYSLIPALQLLHPKNRTIRGRLRVVLSHNLTASGTVQSLTRGRYRYLGGFVR